MQTDDIQRGRLAELSEDECWDLLRSRPVGRVGWSGAEGVTIVPVNFSVEDRMILLRTTPYTLLGRDAAEREVAFEVDVIDQDEHTGWSVLVRGRCVREERASDGTVPWVTGPRRLGLRIETETVSGRRILPHPAE